MNNLKISIIYICILSYITIEFQRLFIWIEYLNKFSFNVHIFSFFENKFWMKIDVKCEKTIEIIA